MPSYISNKIKPSFNAHNYNTRQSANRNIFCERKSDKVSAQSISNSNISNMRQWYGTSYHRKLKNQKIKKKFKTKYENTFYLNFKFTITLISFNKRISLSLSFSSFLFMFNLFLFFSINMYLFKSGPQWK